LLFEDVLDGDRPPDRLCTPNPATERSFGWKVAMEGHVAAITSYDEEHDQGVVHVFERTDSEWRHQQMLSPASDHALYSFGLDLKVHQGLIYASTWLMGSVSPYPGMVFVFARTAGGWRQHSIIEPGPPCQRRGFGQIIELDGDWLFSGNPTSLPHEESTQGLCVMRRESGRWRPHSWLNVDPQPLQHTDFAKALSADDGLLLVGAPGFHLDGRAYLYQLQDDAWTLAATFELGRVAPGSRFGHSVALDGRWATIGVPKLGQHFSDSGAAFIYELGPAIR